MRIGNVAYIASNVKGTIDGRPFGVYSVTEFGARGDGITDDTQAFLQALSAASAGGDIIVPWTPDGYLVSDTIVLGSGHRLIGYGERPVIRLAGGSNCTVIKASSVADITIANLEIDGNVDEQDLVYPDTYIMGIDLDGVTDVRLIDLYVHDTEAMNIKIANSSRIYVERVRCRRTLVDCWSIDNCHNGMFRDVAAEYIDPNETVANNCNGFEIEDGSHNLTFQGVQTMDCKQASGILVRSHQNAPETHSISIRDWVSQGDRTGLTVGRARDVTIDGLTVMAGESEGVECISGSRGIRINNFRIDGGFQSGILLRDTNDVSLANGIVRGAIQGITIRSNVYDARLVAIDFSSSGQALLILNPDNLLSNVSFSQCALESANNASLYIQGPITAGDIRFSECEFRQIDRRGRIGSDVSGVSFVGSRFVIKGDDPSGISEHIQIDAGCSLIRFTGCEFLGHDDAPNADGLTVESPVFGLSIQSCLFSGLRDMIRWSGDQAPNMVSIVGNDLVGTSYTDPQNGTGLVKSGNNPEL